MKKFLAFLVIVSCMLLGACTDDVGIGVIGGSDGPTSVIVGESGKKTPYEKDEIKIAKIGGVLYYETGEDLDGIKCGTMDGKLKKGCGSFEVPTNDGETNFAGAKGWQVRSENTVIIPIEDDCEIFRKIENEKATSYKYCYILEGRMSGAVDDSEFLVLSNEENTTFDDVVYNLTGSNLAAMKDIYAIPIDYMPID